MAIYHFSAQVFSRGKGQSAVAAAAYRSGDRLQDERTGEEKFYKRNVQPESMILAPSDSPEWVKDRERLWNAVEKAEKRKDSQLAREVNVALPVELSKEHQKELICNFIQEQFVDKGMIADINIHRDDPNNPHAHIMLTTREISEEGFAGKNREWNNKELLSQWREEWSNHANKSLEREGIQERISHLSHEALGLEQLPTVHLGHVVNEMEKRGFATERGNLNRERQEYNNLVVDLQKYREEKQTIEQAKARQLKQPNENSQERFFLPKEDPAAQLIQKEIIEKFKPELEEKKNDEKVEEPSQQKAQHSYTTEEQKHLQKARKYLKTEPSFKMIQERNKQIDKWEIKINNGEQYNNWKTQSIRDASYHYQAISSYQSTIQEQQQRLDNINWLNPLKVKGNRNTKEQAENTILSCKKSIDMYEQKLDYHREKFGFTSEIQFKKLQVQHEKDVPELREKNRNLRSQISCERDALKNAETALKRGVIREMANKYPERPEMRHMSYKKASELMKMNEKAGRVIPVEEIKAARDQRHTKVQQLNKELHFVEKENVRLKRTEGFLKEAEKNNAIVEKYEKNPILKGSLLFSKSAKEEYENAISKRGHYRDEARKEGIASKDDWKKQNQIYEKLAAKVPFIQAKLEPLQSGLDILNSLFKAIEQAGYEAQRQQMKKQKGTIKHNFWENIGEQGRER